MKVLRFSLILLLFAAKALAGQGPDDLSAFLPANGEVAGWIRSESPQTYRGNDLYLMINGGAEIYHEYGFLNVLGAEYVDGRGRPISLEIYKMKDPVAAYGIYTFKVAYDGKALAIGQESLLEGYYLNFWKGDIQVTVAGWDADDETVKGVVALAKAVDRRLEQTGKRPELSNLLLSEPLAFSQPRYIRGPLGVMNYSIFGMDNIFRVREGMIGNLDNCRTMVFLYESEDESAEVYKYATARISESSRFNNGVEHGNHYSMSDHKQRFVMIQQKGQYIAIVIGQDQERVKEVSGQLVEKLK